MLFTLALIFLPRGHVLAASQSLAKALSITPLIGFFPLGNLVMNPRACLPVKSGYHTTGGNTYAGRRGRYRTELKGQYGID